MIPSEKWIEENLADYKACRSHREISAVQAMLAQALAESELELKIAADHAVLQGQALTAAERRAEEAEKREVELVGKTIYCQTCGSCGYEECCSYEMCHKVRDLTHRAEALERRVAELEDSLASANESFIAMQKREGIADDL